MSAVFNDLKSPVTFQYAHPNIIQAIINTSTQIIGFFIFTFSFFLLAFNKLISLYFDTVNVLKNITATYITAKYIQVFIQASFENTN